MRTALRTATALALAIPFIASAVPASAGSSYMSRESGSYADAYFQGQGEIEGIDGNYFAAGLSFQGSFNYGWVEAFDCEGDETPGGDGSEPGDCERLGSYDAQVTSLTVVEGKGKGASSRYVGTVDLYEYNFDDPFPTETPAVTNLAFDVTLTPSGGTSRSTSTYTYRDHEAGVFYSFRDTVVQTYATADGDFGGIPAVDGSVGTFKRSSMERIS